METTKQITTASLSSLLAQVALLELGYYGFTGHFLSEQFFGKRGARILYQTMGIAGIYRAISHMMGPNKWELAKFNE